MTLYKISEIFKSIEGEGITAGYPAVFIRFFGCNLRCSYCDSMYAVESSNLDKNFEMIPKEQIIDFIRIASIDHVTLTGGEPLIQPDIFELIESILEISDKTKVNIETNGSIDILTLNQKLRSIYNNRIIVTMDWKSISSRCSNKMLIQNLNLLNTEDVLKFVVSNKEDLNQMKETLDNNEIKCHVFVSPVFNEIDPKEIVTYLIERKLNNVRLQLQLHKIIWDPNKRGV